MNERQLQIKSFLMCSLTESALDPALRVEHVRLSKKEVVIYDIYDKVKSMTDPHRLLARNVVCQSAL